MGERRYRAALRAGLRHLHCVLDDSADGEEILKHQLLENCLRDDLKPLEQARAFQRLQQKKGWTSKQLAEELHMDRGTVSRTLSLLKLPDDVQALVDAGKLVARSATEIARLSGATAQREASKDVIDKGLSKEETAAMVRAAIKRTPRKKVVRVFRTSSKAKVTVQFAHSKIRDEDVIAAIEDALGQAKTQGK